MKLKEKLKEACFLSTFEESHLFDYIYIIPTRRKHDSGYYMYEIYGSIREKFYCLSKCSDVIDLENVNYIVSIDSPEYNVYRFFTHCSNYKFSVPYGHCSTFIIEVKEELKNGRIF